MKTLHAHLTVLLLLVASIATAGTTDADALSFLKQHAPGIHATLTELQATDAADYRDALNDVRKAAEEYAKIEAAGDTVAAAAYLKMYAIDFSAITVSDEILRSKDDAERRQLTARLRQLIAESFDQWAIVEQARIRRLEEDLAALKDDLHSALRDREKVIDSDTAQLIEESRAYQADKAKGR